MVKYCLFILFSLFLFPPSLSKAEMIDRVVAVVNNDIITLQEVNKEGEEFFQIVKKQSLPGQQATTMQKARREVLSKMIDRKIIAQKASTMNLTVSEQELEAAIKNIIAQNRTTKDNFIRELRAMGMTEASYRTSLKEQILRSKIIGYEIDSKIVITEDKAEEYYNTSYLKNIDEGGYYLLHMGFSWNESLGKTREQVHDEAKRVREMAIGGASFQKLAAQHSDLPSAVYGGDIGVMKKDEMAPYMVETINSMRVGEVSPIMTTSSGYQIIKLLAAREGGNIILAPFESVKDEIITQLRQKEKEKQYNKWVKELRADAYIKELL